MLNELELNRLESWGKKFFDKCNKDYVTFDIKSEIDNAISYEENKTQLREKIKIILNEYNEENIKNLKRKEAEIITKDGYEELVFTEIAKAEEQAKLEFGKCLEKIEKDKTTNIIEDYYYIPKQYAKMVANGNAKGFILYGEAGLGKSYTIMRAFREENKDFAYLSGHITSLELYQFLFNHRKEHIILDDCNVLNNEINLNMLKSCLNDNSRLVCYNTSSPRLKAPSRFIFEGTITLLLNDKPRNNENLKAAESRVLNYELKLNYTDKLKILYELVKKEYKELNQEERTEIVNWIRQNTSEATENLNLRVLFMLYEMYRFDKKNWTKLAGKVLRQNEYLSLIVQGISCDNWIEQTGKCRASYFNYKKSLKV